MKKVIVILILVVYIASIAVVNFGGIQSVPHDSITYVDTIQCAKVTFLGDNNKILEPRYGKGGYELYTFDFIPAPEGTVYTTDEQSLIDNPNKIRVDWEVMPHDASNDVQFIIDGGAGVAVYHEMSQTIIVLRGDLLFDVTIEAEDGSQKKTVITIWGGIIPD